MYVIERDFYFSAAHYLPGHPKCGELHGHNWKVTVGVYGEELTNGMIIDFQDIKVVIQSFINRRYDHREIQIGQPPTAENIARDIWTHLRSYLDIYYIKVEENRDSRAIYYPPRTIRKDDKVFEEDPRSARP